MLNPILMDYLATEKLYIGDLLVIDIENRSVSRYRKFQNQLILGIASKTVEANTMCPVYIKEVIVCTTEKDLSDTLDSF